MKNLKIMKERLEDGPFSSPPFMSFLLFMVKNLLLRELAVQNGEARPIPLE
ncbi:MAG: hypothetical protein WEB60_06805 [Terrimicrobiaceae bacterium]